MKYLRAFLDRCATEPALVIGIVTAALALVGIRVSDASASTATQLLAALAPIIAGAITRSKVSPAPRRTTTPGENHHG